MSKKQTQDSPQVEPSAELVTMTKDGEQIEVCSGQVAQHEQLGWQVA